MKATCIYEALERKARVKINGDDVFKMLNILSIQLLNEVVCCLRSYISHTVECFSAKRTCGGVSVLNRLLLIGPTHKTERSEQ